MESRTIENYGRTRQETRNQTTTTSSNMNENWPMELTFFANIYALNLVHRFPSWQTIDNIDSANITKVARLCAVAASIGLEEYAEINSLLQTEQLTSQYPKKVS